MSDSSATLTLRVIKSFPYRTSKNLVLRDVDLDKVSVAELKTLAQHGMLIYIKVQQSERLHIKENRDRYEAGLESLSECAARYLEALHPAAGD